MNPPSSVPQGNRHRVLVVQKGGRAHTWCEDLVAGFGGIGCQTRTVTLRSRSLQERREQWRGGGKLWENQATLRRCADAITEFRPGLILLLNFAGLPAAAEAALRHAAGPGVPLVAWLSDHVSQLHQTTLPNLDAVYAFDSATLEALGPSYGNRGTKLEFMPLAVNPERFPDRGKEWNARLEGLVFIGNHSTQRRELIRQLGQLGVSVTSYGPRAEAGFKVWRRRRVPPVAAAHIYGAYQAVLNMLQPPNTVHGLNLRAYEVPACGGLGTYPLTPDLARSYIADQEIIAYRGIQDLANKSRELFSQPETATRIIAAGRARTLAEHTYAHRASRFVNDWLAPDSHFPQKQEPATPGSR